MKGKAIIPLVLGLGIGLFAVKVAVDAIKKARGSTPAQTTIQVVRAKLDIDIYQAIAPEMVELVDTVESSLIPEHTRLTSLEDVVGRVTAKAIPSASPILTSMLEPPGTPPGLLGRIPRGYRAVAVQIDEVTGVAYQIKPDDWVDVNFVMDVVSRGRDRGKETISGVLFQNVQVALVGRSTPRQQTEGATRAKAAKSATLLIKKDEVKDLHLAQTKGKITLALRGFNEVTEEIQGLVRDGTAYKALTVKHEPKTKAPKPVDPVKLAEVVVPVKPKPVAKPPHGVVIHRGSTHVSFEAQTERLTFQNAQSVRIIDATRGPSVVSGLGVEQLATRNSLTLPWQGSNVPGDPNDVSDLSWGGAASDRSSKMGSK